MIAKSKKTLRPSWSGRKWHRIVGFAVWIPAFVMLMGVVLVYRQQREKQRQLRRAVHALSEIEMRPGGRHVGSEIRFFCEQNQPWMASWSEWLHDRTGFELISSDPDSHLVPVFLHMGDSQLTDASLHHVTFIPDLTGLILEQTRVTDEGLVHLEGLTRLTLLDLARTKVTDAGIERLMHLKDLEELGLSYTQVTDRGLAQIAQFKNLKGLYLDGTAITDQGLAHLKGMEHLETLTFANTQVTDSGLAHVGKIQSIRQLNYCSTNVTEVGVSYVAQLKNLELVGWCDGKIIGDEILSEAFSLNLSYGTPITYEIPYNTLRQVYSQSVKWYFPLE